LHADSQILGDKDKGFALTVAVDNLGILNEETEESQLSILEAARLAHLDAIQEHDAQFARSIANTPLEDWEEIGDEMEDPFDVPHGPNELLAYNDVDDQFDSVLRQLGDAASTLPRKRLHADLGKSLLVISRAKMPTTVKLQKTKQQGKGKEVLQEGDDDDALPDSPLPVRSHSGKSRQTVFLPDSLDKDGDATGQTDGDGECGQRQCQICFDATLATSPFVSLEGGSHSYSFPLFCCVYIDCLKNRTAASFLSWSVHTSFFWWTRWT